MHGAAIASGLEVAGAVLAVVLNAPQAWRSCRERRVDGLSPAARWLAVLQAATWVAYGLTGGGPVQVLTNTVCGVLHVCVLAALLLLSPAARAPRLLVPQAAASLLWLAAVVAAATTGAVPVGALAAACGVAALVPQLVHLLRSRGSDTSGLSAATTWLTLACALCFTGNGLLLAGPAVWLPSGLGVLAAGATLVLLGERPARPAVVDLTLLEHLVQAPRELPRPTPDVDLLDAPTLVLPLADLARLVPQQRSAAVCAAA